MAVLCFGLVLVLYMCLRYVYRDGLQGNYRTIMRLSRKATFGFAGVALLLMATMLYVGVPLQTNVSPVASTNDKNYSTSQLFELINQRLKNIPSLESAIDHSTNTTRLFNRLGDKEFLMDGQTAALQLSVILAKLLKNLDLLTTNMVQLSIILEQESVKMNREMYDTLVDALHGQANDKREIMLVVTDTGYAPMALNLYLTSMAKLKIDNFLFIGSDMKVCEFLNAYGAVCFTHFEDTNGDTVSNWGTSEFRRKTHFKTKIILDALKYNYSVLISDVDIVLFKNPFEHLRCKNCDIQIQNDQTEGNSGFYFTRPTAPSIELHQTAWKASKQPKAPSNQKLIDRNMEKMIKNKKIKVELLKDNIFPNGQIYFEKGKRMFLGDNPCTDCVLVHNNWIVSADAKEFRFKENGLWDVDTNGYYSDPSARYILYRNPNIYEAKEALNHEVAALKNALIIATLLNRTVIMPSFTCHSCKYGACKTPHKTCSFHTHYRVTKFNEYFRGLYRESVFLKHPKVPKSVTESLSPHIELGKVKEDSSDQTLFFEPKNISLGADGSEIVSWFGAMNYSVLVFTNLYGPFSIHSSVDGLEEKLSLAFSKTDYRQY